MLEVPEGEIIYESSIIMDCANNLGFADERGNTLLWPHELYGALDHLQLMKKTALMKMDMNKFAQMCDQNFWPAFKAKWE